MKLRQIISTVERQVLVDARVDQEISCAAASDLMSDVPAFSEPYSILVTGLCNPQVVLPAATKVADIAAVLFVHGKVFEAETPAPGLIKGDPPGGRQRSAFRGLRSPVSGRTDERR